MAAKILIVDDDANVRTTLTDIFAELGYEITEAASGEEALEKVSKEKPDLVLLDTSLPRIDGFEVCRQIKEVEESDTKVIVYTGKIDAIDAVKARRVGADDYCVKGADPSLLVEAVKKLERSEQNEQARTCN